MNITTTINPAMQEIPTATKPWPARAWSDCYDISMAELFGEVEGGN